MSSSTNPLLTSLIPGGTQTAGTLSLPYGPSGGTSTGQNPMMPAVPGGPLSPATPYSNYNFAANASPYTNTSTAPLPVQNVNTPSDPTGGQAPVNAISAGLGMPSTDQGQHQLWDQLNKTYGSGMATTIENFLNTGAGFNQTAINQLLATLQPGFNKEQQNLLTSFGATGNRFSSGAQIGMADLMGQEQLDVGQVESQMYEQSVNDYINVLMGTATADSNRIVGAPSTWDQVGGILGSVGGGILSALGL